MPTADRPGLVDEAARQQALDRYRVVDSLPEGVYDDIVKVAAVVCDTPIALVTLIDRDRQWFKARIGLDVDQTPRSEAVCDYAIRDSGDLFEVRDLSKDDRFSSFPAVTDKGARFYAGMPLVTPEGAALGTVCVVDNEPRELTQAQRGALEALARLTMQLLEARNREREQELAALLLSGSSADKPGEEAATDAASPASELLPYAIAILELQGHAAAVQQRGERGVEKELHQLEESLEPMLRRDRGDTIDRVTGSAELVAILHGDDVAERAHSMESILGTHRQRTGLNVLLATANAESPNEPAQRVFMRADAALSARKDQNMGSAYAA